MKWSRVRIVLMIILGFSPLLPAQDTEHSATLSDKPTISAQDLSGVWIQASAVSIQWFDSQGNRLKDLPMTPWAETKFKANSPTHGPNEVSSVLSTDPIAKCLPPGVPSIYMMTFPMEIVQIPGRVIMFFEYDHYVRQIFTDGRPHQNLTPTWMGDSIGKWQGDSFVIDTNGFNDKTWIDNEGHPHSDALHVIERIRRIDHQTMEDDINLEDPKAYTTTLTTKRILTLKAGWNIVEYICEDNDTFLEYQKTATEGNK